MILTLRPARVLSVLFVALTLWAPVPATASSVGGNEHAEAGDLERSLSTIRVANLEADLHFLASDELEGRDSPSTGLKVAARYIVVRLQHLGFQHGAKDGYLYEYPLVQTRLDEERSGMTLTLAGQETALQYGTDYLFRPSRLRPSETEGEVYFCGDGSVKDFEEAKASGQLEGRWAMVWGKQMSWRAFAERRSAAKEAGAVGILLAREPGTEAEPYMDRAARWVPAARKGRVGWPSPASTEPVFPTIYLSAALVKRLVEGHDTAAAGLLPARLRDVREVVGADDPIQMENVCGFWPGRHPELSKDVIILSAHYDHVGVDDKGVYNGADDNGSGTVALLGVAEALAAYGPLDRSVMLIWVSAEEKGLLGARAWAENPWLPEGHRPLANVNIDMIGRNDPDKLLITPTVRREEYNGLVEVARRFAPLEGFPELGSCDSYWRRSDHYMFHKHLSIPVAFLFSDVHEDYHGVGDTPDKIDYDKVRRVSRLVTRLVHGLQAPDLDLMDVERPVEEEEASEASSEKPATEAR